MGKRIAAVLLSLLLLTGLALPAGAAPLKNDVTAPVKLAETVTSGGQQNNPFAQSDTVRRDHLQSMRRNAQGSVSQKSLMPNAKDRPAKNAAKNADLAAGRIFMVRFKKDATPEDIYTLVQDQQYEFIGNSENRLIKLTTSDIDAFKEKAGALIDVVEKDKVVRQNKVPNDAYYNQQWALPSINVPAAWDITTGRSGDAANPVYVAVIDSGVDRSHPDLDDSYLCNGYDYLYGGEVDWDTNGHGTGVTGIIAAETNNAVGIAGTCWDIAIVPLLVSDSEGQSSVSITAQAIYDAADLGCKVINLSLGGKGYSQSFQSAIDYAVSKGCIVVAAAGNDGNSSYNYPASCEGVISVGAVNNSLKRSSFSNYNDKLDVCAPGEDIVTTHDPYFAPNDEYVLASGTSFSAPYVSGVAALAACVKSDLNASQFLSLIKSTSRDLGAAGYDTQYGYGLIDAAAVVRSARDGLNCTVTFDSQSGSAVASKSVSYNKTITAPKSPTRTGYTFKGWYKEPACINAWNFSSFKVTGNITLYAKWAPITYTVSFNSQGGSSVSRKSAPYDTLITAPAPPRRTGYTFTGWYKQPSCITPWDYAADKVHGNTTIYAGWSINTYTVTFLSGGEAYATRTAKYNTTAILPPAPTQTGYTFSGWYKDTRYRYAFKSSTKVTGDLTVYAKWTINTYTVSFNSQGGSRISSIKAYYNTCIKVPRNPSRTGYTFGGWFKDAACTTAWNFATDRITSGTTLYAKWTINIYTVAFNAQGGSTVPSTTAPYNTTIASPVPPVKTGYTFAGWYKDSRGRSAFKFTYRVTSNLTLYAKWNINNYRVTFDSTGGNTVRAISANHGSLIKAPSTPKRTGCTFAGWFVDKGCTVAWNFKTNRVTSAVTLYAKWTVAVAFNSQGGSAVSGMTVPCNTILAEPTPPTRAGYTFLGWYKDAACTRAWNFGADMPTANITLYAKWSIIVTFHSQGGSDVGSVTAQYNKPIASPTAPTRTGYAFGGWYKEAGCVNAWNFATDKVTGSVTLYAKWSINDFQVAFDTKGGSPVTPQQIQYNGLVTKPMDPTFVGKNLDGWYTDQSYTNKWNFIADKVTGNMTLFAKWNTATYSVSFSAHGGSQVNGQTVSHNGLVIEPTAPTRTGYDFDGWYRDASCTANWNFATDRITGDTSLHAKWTIRSFTASFDSKGGTAVQEQTTNYNTLLSRPDDPVLQDNAFGGWYTDADCTIAWDFAADKITADITLYAKWTPWKSAGTYQVGTGLPAGEYYFKATDQGASLAVASDNSGSPQSVLFQTAFDTTYVATLREGEYVTFSDAVCVLSFALAPQREAETGFIRVGIDIPSGSYDIATEASGEFYVFNNTSHVDGSNVVTSGTVVSRVNVTLTDGQFLYLSGCTLDR